jgi:hypothetical protein
MVDSNNFGHGMTLTVSGRANVHIEGRAPLLRASLSNVLLGGSRYGTGGNSSGAER